MIIMQPRFSIITPCYNAIKTLPDTVDSVLEQTFRDWEFVLVDDGSTDGTGEWITKQDDSRIRCIQGNHRGRAAARNRAITEAKGEWVTFLDADDMWLKEKLELVSNAINEHPEITFIYTWAAVIDMAGKRVGSMHPKLYHGHIFEELLRGNFICNSTVAVRRDILQKTGGFDEHLEYPEDWDLWIRLSAYGTAFGLGEELTLYRQGSGYFEKNPETVCQSMLKVMEKAQDRFKHINPYAFKCGRSYVYRLTADIYSHKGAQQTARLYVRKSIHETPGNIMNYFYLVFYSLGNQSINRLRSVKRIIQNAFGSLLGHKGLLG